MGDKYINGILRESETFKLLVEKLRDQALKDSDLSRIMQLTDQILEEKETEFRGPIPARSEREFVGKKQKLRGNKGDKFGR